MNSATKFGCLASCGRQCHSPTVPVLKMMFYLHLKICLEISECCFSRQAQCLKRLDRDFYHSVHFQWHFTSIEVNVLQFFCMKEVGFGVIGGYDFYQMMKKIIYDFCRRCDHIFLILIHATCGTKTYVKSLSARYSTCTKFMSPAPLTTTIFIPTAHQKTNLSRTGKERMWNVCCLGVILSCDGIEGLLTGCVLVLFAWIKRQPLRVGSV